MNVMDLNDLPLLPRGCGKPTMGGTYLTVGTGPNGIPISDFLVDPTIKIPPDFIKAMGFTEKTRMVENKEVIDFYDHIGTSGYPNAMDWYNEVALLGYHQKIDPSILKRMDRRHSIVFHSHSRAWSDPRPFYADPTGEKCTFKRSNLHNNLEMLETVGEEFCVRFLREMIIAGDKIENQDRKVNRKMPWGSYQGWKSPEGIGEVFPAIFFFMPAHMFDVRVYEDPNEGKHEQALDQIEGTQWEECLTFVGNGEADE